MSPIINYAKRGLGHCYMPDRQCWSAIYHLDGRAQPNESQPARDTFYSLNVILGLAALDPEDWKDEYDLPALLQINAARLFNLPVPVYAMGMALWASARLGVPLEPGVMENLHRFIGNRFNWPRFRAQDTGMLLSGICAQKTKGYAGFDNEAHALYRTIKDSHVTRSGLFLDDASGLRRDFTSFATQTYLTAACYHYGFCYSSEEALAIADTASRKLISLQGPDGEWPWFFYAPKGIVVDHYETYSVHQNGMAPLFLDFAEQRGVHGARQAITKGFNWIFGANQLGYSMMVPELGMFYRSILRRGELANKRPRMRRAIANALTGSSDSYADPTTLILRRECRSYELGWVLYSFGARKDMPGITHHPVFDLNPLPRIVNQLPVAVGY